MASDARPIILIVEDEPLIAMSYEDIVTDAGFLVGASLLSCASAGKWLSAHSPDAAIIDVKLQDGWSVDLAKLLSVQKIPFLVVSGYSPGSPGVDQIFLSVPWLEKPITSTCLGLALRGLLPSRSHRSAKVPPAH